MPNVKDFKSKIFDYNQTELNKPEVKEAFFPALDFGNVYSKVHKLEKIMGNKKHQNFKIKEMNNKISEINNKIKECFEYLRSANRFHMARGQKILFYLMHSEVKESFDLVCEYFNSDDRKQKELKEKYKINKELLVIKNQLITTYNAKNIEDAISKIYKQLEIDLFGAEKDAPFGAIRVIQQTMRFAQTDLFKNPKNFLNNLKKQKSGSSAEERFTKEFYAITGHVEKILEQTYNFCKNSQTKIKAIYAPYERKAMEVNVQLKSIKKKI